MQNAIATDTDTDTASGALAMNTIATAIATAIQKRHSPSCQQVAPYSTADAALDILREESRNYGAAGAAVWAALVSAVMAGISVEVCRKAMRDAGVPKGTANVYAAQVAALADAGQLTAGVPQSVGAKAYAAARKVKRDAEASADAEAPAASVADATSENPRIMLTGGLSAGLLPEPVDGVIHLDPAACAAMLRAIGWTVYSLGEAPAPAAPKAPARSRKSAVTA